MSKIESIAATVRFTDGVTVKIASQPNADPAKAITELRKILDSPRGTDGVGDTDSRRYSKLRRVT